MIGFMQAIIVALFLLRSGPSEPIIVRVPVEAGEVDVTELVARLADCAGMKVARPGRDLRLPVRGLAGSLTRKLLTQSLGDAAVVEVGPDDLVIVLPGTVLEPEFLPGFRRRVADLARRAEEETLRRSLAFGLHARESYRPNDPARPTICLVHGLNSTSDVFVHMFAPLEEAGFGLVVYDFPYNRDLDETARAFGRDWTAFREREGDRQPWIIVAHSMGSLLARWYVEADAAYAHDVSKLILIAPPNQGSNLAKAQTLLQLIQSSRAVRGRESRAFARLSDGLGQAADDMLPGSAFIKDLNRRPRRAGVAYHILAGDAGFLTSASRRQIETQLDGLGQSRGLFGGLARLAVADLRSRLDEMTQGLGDGCVSVASTRLDGVNDHRTIHANHLELIRAPLLYPEPGPVASMPFVLRCLGQKARAAEATVPAD